MEPPRGGRQAALRRVGALIFVTVGGQKAFDRLVTCIDEWATERALPSDAVFAQIGRTDAVPRHIESAPTLEPAAYREIFGRADVVLGHAGMGTILTALDLGKPLLVMPREAARGEHRNDHQLATARQLETLIGLQVAWGEKELRQWLERLSEVRTPTHSGKSADRLASYLKAFMER